jgi:hypothetical protein
LSKSAVLAPPEEVKPIASYGVTANGKQIGLPFDSLEAAKQFVLKNFREDDTVLVIVEVYDADQPMRRLMWTGLDRGAVPLARRPDVLNRQCSQGPPCLLRYLLEGRFQIRGSMTADPMQMHQ